MSSASSLPDCWLSSYSQMKFEARMRGGIISSFNNSLGRSPNPATRGSFCSPECPLQSYKASLQGYCTVSKELGVEGSIRVRNPSCPPNQLKML